MAALLRAASSSVKPQLVSATVNSFIQLHQQVSATVNSLVQ